MALNHTPYGSPPLGYTGPNRSLILAGGGMRLSYQAGALRALLEAGLCFNHVDGTSGGAINTAMLLSGLSPVEMCDRWRTLNLRQSISPLPLQDYLRSSGQVALGDGDGFINNVFPHLGIDIGKIKNTQGMAGTFNLYNYTAKSNQVILHEDMDIEALMASISLPGVFPPVERKGDLYLDSAFVRDANPLEAVRRGASELWIIWCLGDTKEYLGGLVNLYVQTLEMSAVGALHEDIAHIKEINERIGRGETVYGHTEPIKLHMVKPVFPLPLDTDLYLGGVDNATLIDMGYADARRYLLNMNESGLPFEPEVTRMESGQLGITFRETMSGGFSLGETDPREGQRKGDAAGTKLSMHASINIRDIHGFTDDPEHAGEITGHIDFSPMGENMPAKSGAFNLFTPTDESGLKLMVYELGFDWEGKEYYMAGRKEVHNDPGFDLWTDTTTLLTTLHEGNDSTGPVVGAGVLSLGVDDLVRLISTARIINAHSPLEHAETLTVFGKFFMGEIWELYADRLAKPLGWWQKLMNFLFRR